jgi:hypothetical protein
MPRRPAADHEHIDVFRDLGFKPTGQSPGANLRGGRDPETKACGS